MNFLPLEIESLITDYKYELEHKEKLTNVLNEMKNTVEIKLIRETTTIIKTNKLVCYNCYEDKLIINKYSKDGEEELSEITGELEDTIFNLYSVFTSNNFNYY